MKIQPINNQNYENTTNKQATSTLKATNNKATTRYWQG